MAAEQDHGHHPVGPRTNPPRSALPFDCLFELTRTWGQGGPNQNPEGSVFHLDTRFERIDHERFVAAVTDRWNGLHGRPLGGYVLSLALRPLRSVLPFSDLLVTSAFFLQPVTPGQVEIHTEVIRIGRRSATGQTHLFQDGKEALRATATFTDLCTDPESRSFSAIPPKLPPPSDAIDLTSGDPPPPSSVASRVEYRVAEMPGWRSGRAGGDPTSELWVRLTEGGGEDSLTIPLLVDVAAPAVMEIGVSGSTTVELTVHVRGRPVQGWQSCRASTRFIVDGYHEEDFELWDESGRIVAQARQLAIIRD